MKITFDVCDRCGRIRNDTKEYKISDSVVFWKYQENPYKYISKADFLVSSSDFEGFHLAIFESLYLKKRIITTRSISDFDELITDDLGKIIPVNNLDELVDAIRNEIIYKKSINEIPKFLDSFKIKNVANKYLEYIDK